MTAIGPRNQTPSPIQTLPSPPRQTAQAPLENPRIATPAAPRPTQPLPDALGAWSLAIDSKARPSPFAPGPGGSSDQAAKAVPLLDPGLLLMALQSELRVVRAASARGRVEDGAARSELAHAQRQEALAKAEEARGRARRLLRRAPRWLKKLVSGVIAAVGVVASAYTGGASMALAIAGSTLLLAGDAIAKGLERAGVSTKAASWIGIGLKAAGVVLSAVSGVGVADALPRALEAADTVSEVLGATTRVVEGAQGVASGVLVATQGRALVEADDARERFDEAREAVDEATRDLGAVMAVHARIAARLTRLAATSSEARLAAIRQIA